jgi:hypothetical protein
LFFHQAALSTLRVQKGRIEEISKEDSLDAINRGIQEKAARIVLDGDAHLTAVSGRVSDTMRDITAANLPTSSFLMTLSRENLTKLHEKADGTNGDTKVKLVMALVFRRELVVLSAREKHMSDMRDLMFDVVLLALNKEFLNEADGKLNWRGFKTAVDNVRANIDRAAGADAAAALDV